MRLGVLILAAVLCASAHAGDDLDAARRALHGPAAGWAAAFQQFRLRADAGDASACLYLGLMYRNGMAVEVDKARAARWIGAAAQQGMPAAMFTLSNMLAAGEGVERDGAGARRWLAAAAEQEYPEALQQLALTEADPARAAQLMREAAHALTHRRSGMPNL